MPKTYGKKNRGLVGNDKFCILVDEAVDESHKEQMAIILRFVDYGGFIRKRFFEIIHVEETTVLTLKTEICKALTRHNLQVKDMRGQRYDGASNMCGAWNGLQALFIKDCPMYIVLLIICSCRRLQQLKMFMMCGFSIQN